MIINSDSLMRRINKVIMEWEKEQNCVRSEGALITIYERPGCIIPSYEISIKYPFQIFEGSPREPSRDHGSEHSSEGLTDTNE